MKWCLILYILINPFIFYGQDEPKKISFVSYWSNGDDYNFKVTKIKQQWKGKDLIKNDSIQYIANFKVIDSTSNSYKINWSYETNLKNTYNIPEELLKKFEKYKITNVIYLTSELGEFKGIVNWKEIGTVMTNMFYDLINFRSRQDELAKSKLKKSLLPLINLYKTKQGIEQLVLSELQYFHFPFGLEYNISEPLIYEDKLPNMFGGEPIKGNGKIYFENVDFEERFCLLKQEVNLDASDTRKLLKKMFEKMNISSDELKKVLKNAVFDIKDRNVYEYYYDPGIPHRIETVRETVIDINSEKGKRIDKTVIELIYND
jgi:hypothetical protein